jgi:hypothetical protein
MERYDNAILESFMGLALLSQKHLFQKIEIKDFGGVSCSERGSRDGDRSGFKVSAVLVLCRSYEVLYHISSFFISLGKHCETEKCCSVCLLYVA